ncbi:MAG: hypothetical protein GY754_44465 [bacterium]|nr:hypothetical protein [bacterium]
MEYKLKIEEETYPFEVETGSDNDLRVIIEEKNHAVRYTRVSNNQVYLDVDGKGVNVFVTESDEGKVVVIKGVPYVVQDADAQQSRRKKSGREAPAEVTPPMPAVVVRILAAEGDEVEKGQGVVVVSAMKMETTLGAPYNGTVTKINTAEGEKVMPGDILVDIEKNEEAEETE